MIISASEFFSLNVLAFFYDKKLVSSCVEHVELYYISMKKPTEINFRHFFLWGAYLNCILSSVMSGNIHKSPNFIKFEQTSLKFVRF